MIKGERPTFSGKYYRTTEAMANPRFRDHIPLMIGGSGEKKTMRLAARFFDHLNIMAGFDDLPRKVAVVNERCEEIGRDPSTLETSMLVIAMIDENVTADAIPDNMKQRMVVGRRRSDRRPDQGQGLRRRRRRRDPEHADQHPGLPAGPDLGAGCRPDASRRGLILSLTWETTQPNDATIRASADYRNG